MINWTYFAQCLELLSISGVSLTRFLLECPIIEISSARLSNPSAALAFWVIVRASSLLVISTNLI